MSKKAKAGPLSRIAVRGSILALAAAAIALPLALLIGWRTAYQLGNCLFLIGGLVIGMGAFSIFGSWGSARNFRYQHAESAGLDDIPNRTKRTLADLEATYSFAAIAGLAGLLLILTSIILQSVG